VDASSALLAYNFAIALLDHERQAAAEMWFHSAVQSDPLMAEPHFALGTIYMFRDPARACPHARAHARERTIDRGPVPRLP
jgi:hypothetical protein